MFVVMLVGPQPVDEAMPEPAVGGAVQVTVTLLVYQPLLPSVPVTTVRRDRRAGVVDSTVRDRRREL